MFVSAVCQTIRPILYVAAGIGVWVAGGRIVAGPNGPFQNENLEVVFQFSLGPAGMTSTPDGCWLLSVNQAEKPRTRVVKVVESGAVEPFPNDRMSDAMPGEHVPLDAVEGMTLDGAGIVWMLDNGRRSEMTPKVVAWNYEKRRLHSIHHIGEPAVVPGSFLADLAVDMNHPFLYITDPANGANAALIVMDRATGLARRVLQGHRSVVPDESVPLTTGRSGTASKRLDGSQTLPHNGADPIVLDKKGEWLYFAAIRSAHVYRVRTEHLRDPALDPAKLAEHVETWAGKPAATSFTLDARGNLYLGDVEGRAVGVIENDKKRVYRVLVSDPRLVWPDALCFGPDEKLYFFSRLSPGGVAKSPVNQPASMEHNLFRIQPLTGGRLGD